MKSSYGYIFLIYGLQTIGTHMKKFILSLIMFLAAFSAIAQLGNLDPSNPFSEYNRIGGSLNPDNPFSELNKIGGSLNPSNPFSEQNRIGGSLNPNNPFSETNRIGGKYNPQNPFRDGELPTLVPLPNGRNVIVLPNGRVVR